MLLMAAGLAFRYLGAVTATVASASITPSFHCWLERTV
jgi:hypothetical protein